MFVSSRFLSERSLRENMMFSRRACSCSCSQFPTLNMSERGFVLSLVEIYLNRFSRRMGGSEEMMVASNSAYGQDECRLLVVKIFLR